MDSPRSAAARRPWHQALWYRFRRYLRHINYLAVLLCFTAFMCLLFAVILVAIGPPTLVRQNILSSPVSNNTNTTTTTTTTIIATTSSTSQEQQQSNNDTTQGNNTATMGGQTYYGALGFQDALFVSVSAFTASGLSTVNYEFWGTGPIFVVGLAISMGSIVLLTMLPAVLRYRPLAEERMKLLTLLEATGAYHHHLNGDEHHNNSHHHHNDDGTPQNEESQKDPTTASSVVSSSKGSVNNNNNNNKNKSLSEMTERERTTSILSRGGTGNRRTAFSPTSSSPTVSTLKFPSDENKSAPADAATESEKDDNNSKNEAGNGGDEALMLSENLLSDQKLHDSSSSSRRNHFPAISLSAAKRMVIEDGLAHVNQQIDICLIIIFGCITYFVLVQFVFLLLVLFSGKSFGWSLFHVVSAFNNAGFALQADSMQELGKNSTYLTIIFMMIMPLGNSLFPIALRVFFSGIHRLLKKLTADTECGKACVFGGQPLKAWEQSLWLFLRYPRRYYTHMFSTRTSLILFGVWLAFTVVGLLLLVPELNADNLLPDPAQRSRAFWIGLFQSLAVRTTGFAIVNISAVSPAHLSWFSFSMYVGAYSLILTIRSSQDSRKNSSKSQEDEVGDDDDDDDVFGGGGGGKKKKKDDHHDDIAFDLAEESSSSDDDDDNQEDEDHQDANAYLQTAGTLNKAARFVKSESANEMTRDLTWLYTAVVIIGYCEQTQKRTAATIPGVISGYDYSIFLRIVFEVCSAFGNVGLSAPDPGDVHNRSGSFSGSFQNSLSVLVVILVMYFGKMRTVPRSLDEATRIHVRKYDFTAELDPDNATLNDIQLTARRFESDSSEQHEGDSSSTNSKTAGATSVSRREVFRQRVQDFYEHYNPSRLSHVDEIIVAFEAHPRALLKNLCCTYGPEPTKSQFGFFGFYQIICNEKV